MATKNQIAEGEQLDEFKSVDRQSEVPEPTTQGSAKRGADKTEGEAEYSQTTKSEVLAALMNDLQARSADEVLDVYKAVASTNPGANRHPADKMQGGGETYDTTTHSPTAVKPVHAREDVEDIFSGSELSEELKDRAATVYEAAVNARIAIVETRLQEQYTEALEEAIDLVHEEMIESVDKYMSYVANQWMEANILSVDSGLKAEMAEEFLLQLKDIFESNYITVSDDREDVLESMVEKIEHLEARLNEEVEKNIALGEELEEARVAEIIDDMSEGLTVSQKEKFHSLVESISYSDVEDFASKVETIKESVFSGKTARNAAAAEPLTEGFELEEEKPVASNMKAYVDVISRTTKR